MTSLKLYVQLVGRDLNLDSPAPGLHWTIRLPSSVNELLIFGPVLGSLGILCGSSCPETWRHQLCWGWGVGPGWGASIALCSFLRKDA